MKAKLLQHRVMDNDADNPYIRCQYIIPGYYLVRMTYIDHMASFEAEGLKGSLQPTISYIGGQCILKFPSGFRLGEGDKVNSNILEAENIAAYLVKNAKTLIISGKTEFEIPGTPPDT